MTKLYGKTAIVTGTSRPGGIGTAVCRTLAQEGANVFYTHLYDYDKIENPGDADKNWPDLFAEELRSYGVKAAHMEVDLTDPNSPAQLLDACRSALSATKGAVSTFTECLSAELAPFHITVNAVDPGPTDTGWMSEEVKKALLPEFPMGRIGLPEDVSRLIAFLASDDSQWITGQIIHSRGGF